MPTLRRCLQDHDLGLLLAIAETTGLEPPAASRAEVAGWLERSLQEPDLLSDNQASLSTEARSALQRLLANGGRMPMPDFTREFGAVREFGPARRDREHPWRNPVSATEHLWYRGLIGRAFFDTPGGPQEYVYIPDELLNALGPALPAPMPAPGAQATKPQHVSHANSAIIDDATSLLAYYRRGSGSPVGKAVPSGHFKLPLATPLLEQLLLDLALLQDGSKVLDRESTREFLALARAPALHSLVTAWRNSRSWNDLAALGELQPGKDGWPNDPLQTRNSILAFLEAVPTGAWWDLPSFIEAIYQTAPGFQRPAGTFDTWYLRDGEGRMLNGIEAWDHVEGALLRFVIVRVLHWLGIADLGLEAPGGAVQSFRLTPAAELLFHRAEGVPITETEASIRIDSGGNLRFSRGASRTLRYQFARFSQWVESEVDEYHYRITPAALELALEQGLKVKQIKQLLEECETTVPPSLLQALDRWERHGLEARIEKLQVLRTKDEALMQTLLDRRGTRRYLKDLLNPQAALIAAGDVPRLIAAAAREGIFISAPDILVEQS